MNMITVFLVDDGQDFLEWDINEKGEVVDCRPFQGSIWNGTKVHNKDIKPGDHLDITTTDGVRRRIIHAVEKVQELV
jgi:hypothetical protein